MSSDNPKKSPIPASNTSIQNANWSGSIPILLSLAPTSLSSPTPPRPIHKMISRVTYLHLALHEEVMHFSGYAPVLLAAGLLAKGFSGMTVVEEPPDDDDSPITGSGEVEGGGKKDGSDAASEKESSTDSGDSPHHSKQSNNKQAAYPECWFEDEASGTPLRWHLFVGVLYDLMKGNSAMIDRSSWKGASNEPTQHNFLPWRIRVHFTSYPTAQLLPLDDGLDNTNNNDDESHIRITTLVRRLFRNSLKQALFMQYASAKVAMSINKNSHGKIWDAVMQSNYASYHEVNVGLQSGIKSPSISTTQSSTTTLTAVKEDQSGVLPQLIPVRIMLNGMPAIQKPTKHAKDNSKDTVRKRPTELLETLGTCQALPYTTLGDVLAGCLPTHFAVDPSTGNCATAVSDETFVYYCVQGVQPSMKCAMVDLWRALSHPDHFLYIIVVTE